MPEDRKALGLFDDLDLQTNLGLLQVRALSRTGILSRDALHQLASKYQVELQIKASSLDAPITSLSGGNQQKVLIARWLTLQPKILVMNEPARGVDIGAKAEIYALIRRLAAAGFSFVVASSDTDELLRVCDRILVLRRGRLRSELSADGLSKHELIHALSAGDPKDSSSPTITHSRPIYRHRWRRFREVGILLAALCIGVVFALSPRLSFIYNLFNLLRQTSELGIVAMAMTVLIVPGIRFVCRCTLCRHGGCHGLAFKSGTMTVLPAAACGLAGALALGGMNGS